MSPERSENGGRESLPPENTVETSKEKETPPRPTDAELRQRANEMIADAMESPRSMRKITLEHNLDQVISDWKNSERFPDDYPPTDVRYSGYTEEDFDKLREYLPRDLGRPEMTSAIMGDIRTLLRATAERDFNPETRILRVCEMVFGEEAKEISPDKIAQATKVYQENLNRYGYSIPWDLEEKIYDIVTGRQ